jgi:hypothetical protein
VLKSVVLSEEKRRLVVEENLAVIPGSSTCVEAPALSTILITSHWLKEFSSSFEEVNV